MKSGLTLVVVALLFALALPLVAAADQATGKVQATARGNFTLDDNGTLRLFSLSSKLTAYEPATWRPTVGDQVDVQFAVDKGVLVVGQVKLLAAADAEPDALYPKGDGRFEFDRTVSRLEEMRSEAYLAQGHGSGADGA